MTNSNNETLNQFIIETVLINPIQKIVDGLKSRNFRDCDIKWLNDKMEGFIEFAAETLGVKVPVQVEREKFGMLNAHSLNYYTTRFTTLLDYFKRF